jgi:hypothetical protein
MCIHQPLPLFPLGRDVVPHILQTNIDSDALFAIYLGRVSRVKVPQI